MHSSIRFVGGPWHNRIEWVEICPRVAVSCKGNPNQLAFYHLAEFYTVKYHTRYYQYVHGSLVHHHTADPCTYRERLKVWRIDRRQLESRLRRAMKWEKN